MGEGLTLIVELGEAQLGEPARYFVTLHMVGGSADEGQQERTDVAAKESATPAFKNKLFSFPVPAGAEPSEWSLELTTIAVVPDTRSHRVVGKAALQLGELITPLLDSGEIEQSVALEKAEDEGAGGPAGTLQVKLRLERAAPPSADAAEGGGGGGGKKGAAKAGGGKKGKGNEGNRGLPGLEGGCATCDEKTREMAHQQALVERLMDDVDKRSAAVARAGEEVMELRGVTKQMEAELTALRGHVAERERAMEQLANDATGVENIDLPQLQSRHRMLGAAYRADRRRMEQLTAQLAQMQASLGTQDQLATSYAQLKDAHRQQAQQMQRLQEEARKVTKYRSTAKQQEAIIQKLETLMGAALKDAKKAKETGPVIDALRKQLSETQVELSRTKAEAVRREEQRRKEMQEEKLAKASAAGQKAAAAEEEGGGGASSEELLKMQMRAEKAERRAAAIEEDMIAAERVHAREVGKLKVKLAEAQAQAQGGFGSAANLALGELDPPGTMALPPAGAPSTSRPPSQGAGARRNSPRLQPLAPAAAPQPAPAVAVQ